MKFVSTSPNPGLIEKEYPYRYKWSSVIGMIGICGLVSFGVGSLALSGKGLWWWWLLSAFLFIFFLFGVYVAVLNLFGNRRLILTRDSIYIPSIWKSEKYTVVRFSEITKMGLVDVQGNAILQLFVGDKEYDITHTWLPSLDTLDEILKITQERVNSSS
jgi:hypothetical protein